MKPVINWNKCDGCGRCVENCPAHVLGLRELSQKDYNELSWFGKLKSKRKGSKRADIVNDGECIGCRTCQEHCHERALKLA